IEAFGGWTERPSAADFIFSDLQSTNGFHQPGRLGSGRTGYYRGRYLKGLGRTALAGNLALYHHRFHATGHLSAGGGIREWIVSRFLKAKGKANLIVPVEGLLVAELADGLKKNPKTWRRWGAEDCLPCDLALQTMTIKDARFSRFSNF